MPRRNHRSRADGLFTWDGHGDIAPGELRDNPRDRTCPACKAPAGKPCRFRGRRKTPMIDYHPARREPARS